MARDRRIDPWLQRLGLDPRCYRALVAAYLVMDFRNQQFARVTYSRPRDVFSPLFWVTGQNLLVSIFLSLLLFARVEAYVFVLLATGLSMFVVATSIIVEFNEIVLDPDDLEIVGHHPLETRTYAAARVTNLLLYVLYVIVSLNAVPSIVGLGLRDTGAWFFVTYWIAALAGGLATAGTLLVLYAALFGGRPGPGLQETLAWTQAVLMLVTGYGGQAVLRDSQKRLEMAAYLLPEWVAWLPPASLARFVTAPTGAGGFDAWMIGLWAVYCLATWWWALGRLSRAYARLQPGRTAWRPTHSRPLPAPGMLAGPLARRLTRPGDERAAFWLCATMLRRDHNLRMRCWPALGTVVAFLAIGLFTDQLDNPLVARGRGSLITLATIYLIVLPIPTILHNLRFSRDHAASWVLAVSPVADRAAFASGLRKAVTLRMLFPLWLLTFAILAFRWRDPLGVAVHAAVGWLVILGAGYACQLAIMRRYPFAEPLGRGETLGSIAPFVAATSGTAMMLAAVHYYAARELPALVAYAAVLLIAVGVLGWRARRMPAARFQTTFVDDEPPMKAV